MESGKNKLKTKINQKVYEYYLAYYRDAQGHKDYEQRIQDRINEDITFKDSIERYKDMIPFFYEEKVDQKILIDGAGTGQELVNFHQMGYETHAIEPFEPAIEILNLKAEYYNIPKERIKKAFAESLPYKNNFFDMVWCWTVLEHVKDYDKSIREIVRVLKPGGWAFMVMPDYRQIFEPHYRVYFPMFLPRFIFKIYLKIIGRPSRFFQEDVNSINSLKVLNILQSENVISMQLHNNWSDEWLNHRTKGMSAIYYFYKLTGIPRDQIWLIKKKH